MRRPPTPTGEFFYGHSPLRYVNDGKDVVPGLVESWESNDDASEWTFNFRKGLKWSDGEPWTTADIMFWWDDIIAGQYMAQTAPDEARSGKGTLAKFTAVDDPTLTMTFDAPAPLTADRMAMWVNGNIGKNGPIWMMPSHYVKQFHPKYGKDVPKNWDSVGGVMETKADWIRNPECPTMTGCKCKSFDNTKGLVLERNPYYYVGDAQRRPASLHRRDPVSPSCQRRRGRQAPGPAGRGRLLPRQLQPDHPERRPGSSGQRRARPAPRWSCGTAARAPGRSSSSTTTTWTTTCAS